MTSPWRRLFLGGAAALLLLTVAAPMAAAVGTSGVDLTPLLPRNDRGSHVLTVHEYAAGEEPALLLTNLTDEPRPARVYAAAAALDDDGSVDVGPAGSLPWLPMDRAFELAPRESIEVALELAPRRVDLSADEDRFAALVLEVSPSESLVTQAVTIVRVQIGPLSPLPTWPLIVAIVFLAAAVLALARFGRQATADEASTATG